MIKYEINKDYEVSYPYGEWAEPQFKICTGTYKGLTFDVTTSYITEDADTSEFTIDYKIVSLCDDVTVTTMDSAIMNKIVWDYINL